MKIVVKEMSKDKDKFIIYIMSDTNQPMECKIVSDINRVEYREELVNRYYPNVVNFEDFTYNTYLNQDELGNLNN